MGKIQKRDPILLDIPESFESERLIIRAPQWGDGEAVHEAIKESIEALRRWLPWAKHVPTIKEAEAEIRRARVHY